MKLVISLTSIPSRFDKLGPVLKALSLQTCHEIWINIPPKYNRFPDWDGSIPDLHNFCPKLKVNRDCEDLGPGTKFLGPAQHLDPGDIIVYLDDDTNYDPKLVTNLLSWHRVDPNSAWGLSGFNFETYFEGKYPRQHGVPLDVLEGYGSVMVKAGWIQNIAEEFKELRLEASSADDVIISNLFEKHGIERKTVFTPICNVGMVQQFDYGFGSDALHRQFNGGHNENYRNVLISIQDKGKNYFSYKCS